MLAWLPAFNAHFDVWVILGASSAAWVTLTKKSFELLKDTPGGVDQPIALTRGQIGYFISAMLVIVGVSIWPVHDIAEQSMYMAHMSQHLLLSLVVPALLILATPNHLARFVFFHTGRVGRLGRRLSRPVAAIVAYNLFTVLSHWPIMVKWSVTIEPFHFLMHFLMVLTGLLLWWPVLSRLVETPRFEAPMAIGYLFVQSLVSLVPASFLTWAESPIYKVYETTPKLWGMTALEDQQTAGLIMKLGGTIIVWTVLTILFFKWMSENEERDRQARHLSVQDILAAKSADTSGANSLEAASGAAPSPS